MPTGTTCFPSWHQTPLLRYKNTLNAALNWYIKETGIDWTSPFAGLLIKGAGSSKADRHPLSDEQVEELKAVFEDDPTTNALFVVLRDSGARVAEIAGLRVTDCNLDEGFINITPTPWRRLKNAPSERSVPLSPEAAKVLQAFITRQGPRRTCLRTLCPTKRYGPGISHDDEAVQKGHHRQEAVDAFLAPQNEGQAQKHRLPRGSLDGYPWTWHQYCRC